MNRLATAAATKSKPTGTTGACLSLAFERRSIFGAGLNAGCDARPRLNHPGLTVGLDACILAVAIRVFSGSSLEPLGHVSTMDGARDSALVSFIVIEPAIIAGGKVLRRCGVQAVSGDQSLQIISKVAVYMIGIEPGRENGAGVS